MRAIMPDYLQYVRGAWRVQYKVPGPLQAIIGVKTLTPLTGVRAPKKDERAHNEARKRARRIVADIQAQFAAAERELRGDPEPYDPSWDWNFDKRYRGRMAARAARGLPPLSFMGNEAVPIPGNESPSGHQPVVRECEAIIADWALERQLTDEHDAVKAKRRAMTRFFAWFNRDKPAAERHTDMVRIEKHDLMGYKKHLLERLADPKDKLIRKSKTVGDQLTTVTGLFRYAFEENKFPKGHGNPGDGVSYKGKTDPRDKYLDFTPDEIKLILTEARKAGHHFVRWFHLIAAYSGARCAEIAEAQTQDVEAVDGIQVFHIRLLNRPKAQRLKTEFSERSVPLHTAVLNEGFLSYVDWVKRTYHGGGDGPLFPMLKMYGGRLNDDASNVSMAWLRGLGIGVNPDGSYDRRKANHSWRHTVKTQFRYYMAEQFSDHMTGHSDGRDGREYGRYPIDMLRREIDLVKPWEI
jgi:hypothetical protein